ncbi:hypothetical protein GCK72_019444 [Caenorhabditis remanei]|uniref:Uncharacterized protein n=1 Tax=Caenorhabditis remanei TaxID=31234 RepID=A0A6A5GEM1_CAERE|nr:hypothetical protein GCK72_019444 [Caenorhabditis remanei]KAF1752889.1 hypothetical protein GCK72_019444 [Caenorhabditis remanei]
MKNKLKAKRGGDQWTIAFMGSFQTDRITPKIIGSEESSFPVPLVPVGSSSSVVRDLVVFSFLSFLLPSSSSSRRLLFFRSSSSPRRSRRFSRSRSSRRLLRSPEVLRLRCLLDDNLSDSRSPRRRVSRSRLSSLSRSLLGLLDLDRFLLDPLLSSSSSLTAPNALEASRLRGGCTAIGPGGGKLGLNPPGRPRLRSRPPPKLGGGALAIGVDSMPGGRSDEEDPSTPGGASVNMGSI